ncbi:uracil phosphoribosyltransferase [Capnocytophaga catalasegens]|uniref:Uracil phosphoribosyltransferase n=1 Tax=Capnocytophaga catalasegens TaxID=1004260 RepID=A0AAV5AVS9_9FLAO|nr:uracil phosphoribosyltransferase [Capnocytophaga catalasegens]GIZ14115.1 uracil phosphoribosyltransferase [Capnocytophaga catalasegens]GJM49113.1 uracil phosphoribosyltransferase [Capnocytophaga catalasegens]GJM52374.1 uracil phosphoribosyltransferase [Capnocytophaga catalasegens]
MIIHRFDLQPSVLHQFIAELRNVNIQRDRMRFRRNLERVGEILSYEMSKKLQYHTKEITTPLSTKKVLLVQDEIVICSILRAGLALHQGILNYFDNANNAFISAYRKHLSECEFEILVEYLASPSLEDNILILADPMLATGRSFVNVYNSLKSLGTPKEIHLFAVIGSEQGLEYVQEHFPKEAHLWIATVDKKLDERSYIVPGLGDAGDLAFGEKMQS